MQTEELRNVFSSDDLECENLVSINKLKKTLNQNLRTIKEKAEYISDSEKNALWLKENAPLLINVVKKLNLNRLFCRNVIFVSIEKLLQLSDFEGRREELILFFELLDKKIGFKEKELPWLKTVFLVLITNHIAKSANTNLEQIDRLFTLFHRIKTEDFEYFTSIFSPVERCLRFDPSGVYPSMTRQSQHLYKRRLILEAKKKNYNPVLLAKEKLKEAKESGKHIGFFLSESKRKCKPIYFSIGLFIVLFLGIFISFSKSFLAALLALPLYFFCKRFVEYIFSLLIKPEILPAMKLDKITQKEKSCLVITCLVNSKKDIDELCEKLFEYKINNSQAEDELYFGLLCDLKESKKKILKEDSQLLLYLDKKITELNLEDNRFFAVLRNRVYHQSEDKWVGYERKRGAIEEFIFYLCTGKNKNSHYFGCYQKLIGSSYLITLDVDTRLGIGQIKRLIGTAAHPLNCPVVETKNGKPFVKSGYGILQPRILSSLQEKIVTPFGKIYGNGSGILLYPTAGFDSLQSFYYEGNFCGKGLIDVKTYQKVLFGQFPEQKILSHDMPEGAILRAALLTDEHFTDSNPQTTISFYKRQHRWIRGDVQNILVFNRLSKFRRFFATENILSYLIPFSEFLSLVLSCFLGKTQALVCALLVLFFHAEHLLFTTTNVLLSGNFSILFRHFSTKIRNLFLNGFYQFVLSVGAIAFEALFFLDAISKSLFRMFVSKKKLLEWQVFSPLSSEKPFLFFLPSFLISIICIFLSNNPITFLIFIICALFPFVSLQISKPYQLNLGFTENQKEFLFEKGKSEFSFFQKCIGPSTAYLPPDNIQFEPVEKIAMRTSPTNIGLYLASLAAAMELKIISEKELMQKASLALESIEKLERWNGHLYNWYDLNTLEPIGERFVSTVDSGNYIAGVIVLLQTVKTINADQSEKNALSERLENEIYNIDFLALYEHEKNLFRVGCFPDEDYHNSSNYDLYMSEARITAYLSIALGQIPIQHWKSLSRPLLSFRGRVGIGSWTGTAFEYFMAPLFLPVIPNSLEDETLEYALYSQVSYSAKISPSKNVFGISESGYSATDLMDNYQYKAFGVPYLSVQPDKRMPKVIAPYASFLMLERGDERVISNLKNLSEFGMEGHFGYFEACEFHSNFIGDHTKVYSCMAHHKAMSILAIANAVCDKIIQKRFISFQHFKSKTQLLAERFPLDGKILKKKRERISFTQEKNKNNIFEKNVQLTKNADRSHLITDGKISLLGYNDGSMRFIWKGRDLFDPKKSGLRLCVKLGNEEFNLPGDESEKNSVIFGIDFVEYTFYIKKALVRWRIELVSSTETILCRFCINGYPGPCSVSIGFDPVIQKLEDFESHPAFHALSMEGSFEKNYFKLRKRGIIQHHYLHLFSERNFCISIQGKLFDQHFKDRMLLSTDVLLRFDYESASNVNTVVVLTPSEKELVSNPFYLFDGEYNLRSEIKKRSLERCGRFQKLCHYDSDIILLEEEVLNAFKTRRVFYETNRLSSVNKDFFWKYGVSGDAPIVTCYVEEGNEDSMKLLEQLLCMFKKFNFSHLSLDLVILHKKCHEYFNPLREKMTDIVSKLQCEFLIGKHPGVHFVALEEAMERRIFESAAILSYFPEKSKAILVEENSFSSIQQNFETNDDTDTIGEIKEQSFLLNKEKYNPQTSLSQVVSNRICGFVCDQNSLGFTWYRNAGLNRISEWDSHPDNCSGEKIYWHFQNQYYDLLQMANKVKYQRHFAVWEGKIDKIEYRVVATISELIAGKIIFVSFSDKTQNLGELIFSFVPVLGARPNANVALMSSQNCVQFSRIVSEEYNTKAYFFSKNNIKNITRHGNWLDISLEAKQENFLCLGGYSSDKHYAFIMDKLFHFEMEELLQKEKAFSDSFFPKKIDSNSFWIRYQTVHSRFFGRTGLYQSSGAYGFRDQLQDSLAFLKFCPEYTKLQILRAASHQFSQGDVMHWWHTIYKENRSHPGIRSRCSDDYLWLLYVTAEYINETADFSILDAKAPFLTADPLKKNQNESYLTAQIGQRHSLLEHLKRVVILFIERGLGPNNLPFIGSGDWNDGMNQVVGESVWLGFFGVICLNRTKELFDEELQNKIASFLEILTNGLRKSFRGSWFPRVFCSDGSIIGSDVSLESECSIDLITQAFSALCYLETKQFDEKMIKSALLSAYDLLYHPKFRTVQLFTPPFRTTTPSPGYIQRYCAGARENGGQYTHAAIWFAIAMIAFGREMRDSELTEKGMMVAKAISPFENINLELFERYQREPYVLCGDIYMANGLLGHGGWSWYTGAAGWYLKLIEEMKKQKEDR